MNRASEWQWRGTPARRARLILAACAAGFVLAHTGTVAQEAPAAGFSEPFPKYDRNSPEGARAVLDWLARATAPAPDGARRCVASNLLVLTRTFPRTEPIDAVFEEYLSRGGVAGAAALYRLGTFEKRVDLVASEDRCVREFVTPLLIREIAQVAEADGRNASGKTTAALQRAVAARDGRKHEFDNAKAPRLWGDFAVLESTSEDKGLLHLLLRDGDGWQHLGAHVLWGG